MEVKHAISSQLGFQSTTNLGRYLGVPLLHNRTDMGTYSYIVDGMEKRCQRWPVKHLSLAGRVALTQRVLSALPSHTMQAAIFPMHTCQKIDEVRRKFIWGGEGSEKRISLIGWNKICQPKEYWGLGVKKAKETNEAFMMKLAWQLVSDSSSMWTQVFQAKYMKNSTNPLHFKSQSTASRLWKGICKAGKLLADGLDWQLRDGMEIRFCEDHWLGSGKSLIELAVAKIANEERGKKVVEYVDDRGQWCWDVLNHFLPPDVLALINLVDPPKSHAGRDTFCWRSKEIGNFSVNLTYEVIERGRWEKKDGFWKCVWKWTGPERIRLFLWIACHGRLLTNRERQRRHLTDIATCPLCGEEDEGLLHAIRDCQFPTKVWKRIIPEQYWKGFFRLEEEKWLKGNLRNELGIISYQEWKVVFGITCWLVWGWRDKAIFQDDFEWLMNPEDRVRECVQSVLKAERMKQIVSPSRRTSSPSTGIG